MPREFMPRRQSCRGETTALAWAYLKRAWGLAARNRGILLRLMRGDADLRRRLALSERRIALARWAMEDGSAESERQDCPAATISASP